MFVAKGSMASAADDLAAGHGVDLVMPYITRPGMEHLLSLAPQPLRVLTQVVPRDVAAGVMSLDALGDALAAGAEVRLLHEGRLHAKVLLSDSDRALVGSANLTRAGMNTNVEAGVIVSGAPFADVRAWFDDLWQTGVAIDDAWLQQVRGVCAAVEYRPPLGSDEPIVPDALVKTILSQGIEAKRLVVRVFVCNSGRNAAEPRTAWEAFMLDAGVAAAWTPFHGRSAIQAVRPGDVVLLYASGSGVVAAGVARGQVRVARSSGSRRFHGEPDADRWEVAVEWTRLRHSVRWDGVPRGTFAEPGPNNVGAIFKDLFRALP